MPVKAFNSRIEVNQISNGKSTMRVVKIAEAGKLPPYNGTPTSKTSSVNASTSNASTSNASTSNASTSNTTAAVVATPAPKPAPKLTQAQQKKAEDTAIIAKHAEEIRDRKSKELAARELMRLVQKSATALTQKTAIQQEATNAIQKAVTARAAADAAALTADGLYQQWLTARTDNLFAQYTNQIDKHKELDIEANKLELLSKQATAKATKAAAAADAAKAAEEAAAAEAAKAKGGRRKRRTYKHRKYSRHCKKHRSHKRSKRTRRH